MADSADAEGTRTVQSGVLIVDVPNVHRKRRTLRRRSRVMTGGTGLEDAIAADAGLAIVARRDGVNGVADVRQDLSSRSLFHSSTKRNRWRSSPEDSNRSCRR